MRQWIVAMWCAVGFSVVANEAQAVSTTIVISELRTRGPNGGNDEFVELFNKSDTPIDVGGYQVMRSDASGNTSVVATIPAGVTMLPGRFYLLINNGSQGYSGTVNGDLTYTGGIPDSGGVGLLDDVGSLVDAVGTDAGSAYQEGLLLPPMSLNVNQSYERKNAGCSPSQDTDENAVDFNVNGSTSHPQRSTTKCDPCSGVVCSSPPSTECYAASGTCSGGSCNYNQFAAGTSCSDGDACTIGDQCDSAGVCTAGSPNPCNTPPSDFCSDPNTLVTYDAVGTCDSGSGCSYGQTVTSCQFGCNGAVAACNPNPCTGVSCVTPPNECYAVPGTCSGGTCSYSFQSAGTSCDDGDACTLNDECDGGGACDPGTPKDVDDGNPCTADACDPATGAVTHTAVTDGTSCDDGDFCNGVSTCQSGTCTAGTPVSCTNPPSSCYESTGTCNPANGLCSYTPRSAGDPCDDGELCTENDACDGSGTCAGATVLCSAPAPTCADSDTSRSFTGGVCDATDGNCDFTPVDTACVAGCNAATGLCNADPCEGIVCDSPPSQCHADTGTCSAGTCSYPLKPEGAACDDGDPCTAADDCSAAGACAGTPLACNTPPSAACADASTSRTFAASGVCDAGVCDYAATDTDCPLGCDTATGLCIDDPCFGVNCDEPPTACHQDLGTCSGGTCSYELKPAGASCDDGDLCTDDDTCSAAGNCTGTETVCNAPPAASCVNANTSEKYDAVGSCEPLTGDCVYTPEQTTCSTGCDDTSGLCNEDPCIGVVCNTPPGDCSLATGTCDNGTCSYGFKSAGTFCDDGDVCTTGDACNDSGSCVGQIDASCVDGGVSDAGGQMDAAFGEDAALPMVDAGVDGGPAPGSGGAAGGGGAAGMASGGGAGGTGGASASGGASGSGPLPGLDGGLDAGDAGDDLRARAHDSGGCGCRVPNGQRPSRGPLALIGMALLLWRRRRRSGG